MAAEYTVRLEQFEGPLHLLLELIGARQLDITQLSLAAVAEQFWQTVQDAGELDPEVAADFLVVASKLVLIKSRTLLPEFSAEVEEEASELERQLKLYREFVQASEKLKEMALAGCFTYPRRLSVASLTPRFSPPPGVETSTLASAFARLRQSLEPAMRLPKQVMERVKTVAERLRELMALVSRRVEVTFSQLTGSRGSQTERIISFLALLELVKRAAVEAQQLEHFGEISIVRAKAA